MPAEKEPAKAQNNLPPESKALNPDSEDLFAANEGQDVPAHQTGNEIATNDGTVIETLDTALHNKPGINKGETESGSNRADYYESRSYGKTDAEEELDALKREQSQ